MDPYSPRYAKPSKEGLNRSLRWAIPIALFALGAALGAWIWILTQTDEPLEEVFVTPTSIPIPTPTPAPTPQPTPVPTLTPIPEPDPYPGWVDPESVGEPWGTTVSGLLTFRGNPTRTFYGTGPIPNNPEIKWEYPENELLCGVTMLDYQNEE